MKPEVLTPCSACGEPTEWDYELGDSPFCPECWDKLADKEWVAMAHRGRKSKGDINGTPKQASALS